MTKAKKVAGTLKNVLDNEIMMTIMDKGKPIDDVITEVLSWWDYDLYTRRPGPAYDEDGVFVGTDLDLACFISALAQRNGVINLPTYQSMRNRTIKEGQVLTSKENRHGTIVGVSSNKETLSFSVRIVDANIMTTDKVGDYRNFALTNLEGEWHDGWKRIEFIPTAKENKFLTENELWSGNSVVFNNFVHPNRWISFYGQYYFITKALIERLRSEAADYNFEIKEMLEEGIKYPVSGEGSQPEWPETTREKGKSVVIKAFEVELDIPENDSSFPKVEHNQENLVRLTRKRKDFIYKIVPRLQFATRATELAFVKYGEGKMPGWLDNVKWENDFKLPKKQKKWDRLVLFQPGVGKRAVSIRKRLYDKSEIVSENY